MWWDLFNTTLCVSKQDVDRWGIIALMVGRKVTEVNADGFLYSQHSPRSDMKKQNYAQSHVQNKKNDEEWHDYEQKQET